jgi:peptidoglycan/xylan/chitin deacetylase (PgdA/CDA1 family)
MTPEQEEAVMDRCIELIERISGRRPTGYVAPWWEFSTVTNELLLKRGIKYDHSLMNDDFHPFYVRVGDSWTPIDYSKHPNEWMRPLVRGEETDLIDIPGSWYLDDLPPMMFIKSAPNSHGFIKPRDIEELWCDQFDWVYREYDYAVFTMTIHPDVSGRPQVLLMLERMYDYISKHAGVKFCTFDEIADDFRRRCRGRVRLPPKRRARAERRGRALSCARCAACSAARGIGATAPAPRRPLPVGPSRRPGCASARRARACSTWSSSTTASWSVIGRATPIC